MAQNWGEAMRRHAAERRGELDGVERIVGVADAPVLLRIAEGARGDQVQPVALRDA